MDTAVLPDIAVGIQALGAPPVVRRSRMVDAFTAAKFVFEFRSLRQLSTPLPPGMKQPIVGLPLASLPVIKRTPPSARTLNWLVIVDVKLALWLSAQTKAP